MCGTNICNGEVDLIDSNIVEGILSPGMGVFVNDDKRLADMDYRTVFLQDVRIWYR